MKRLFNTPARLVCVFLVVILTIESASFTGAYLYAFQYLQQHDPRKSTSRSELRVFFRPKVLARGQEIGRDEIVRHLAALGYREGDESARGTFSVSGDALTVRPRYQEFPGAVISFARRRIASISVGGQPVERVELEPQPMVSFLRFMPEDLKHRTRARRIILQPGNVPEPLSDAICSSEDKRCYTHNGIDELGMMSAVLTWLKGSPLRGGSTLTQQLIKNTVLDDQSRTGNRKAKEFFLALAAERMMTKQEIMAAYASACYMGHVPGGPDIYGMAAAAFEYFGVSDLRQLGLGQAATLAGMLDGPADYVRAARNGDYTLLLNRRTRVLNLMHRNFPDKYTAETVEKAEAEPLELFFASEREQEQPLDMSSIHFQNFAAAQVQQVVNAASDGYNLRVYTTIDPELQSAAHQAVADQLSKLDAVVAALCRRQNIDPSKVKPIQAALVAMDAQTGEILAMADGRDVEFNYATRRRSPGSAVKPFVYLKAIESGRHQGAPFTAATFIDPLNDPVYGTYRPQNHVGVPARARVQLAASYNGGAVVAAHDAGLPQVRELIYSLTDSRADELSGMLAVGGAAGSEVTLLDLVSGYAVFPTGGRKLSPTPFTAVYQNEADRVNVPHVAPLRVTGEASAYVLTQMMRSVLQPGGTAPNALSLAGLPADAPVAAKSGSGQVADLTFVGFSPRIVVGVWCGMPDNVPALKMEDGFSGARAAMPIWAAFMRAVKRQRGDLLQGDFRRPAGVQVLRVDAKSGCVTGGAGVEEYFIQGREPALCKKN
jgi:penicillin-binding protein 1B